MSARTWTEGDPEPADHPAVVDNDGITWLWDVEDDWPTWTRMQVTHHTRDDGQPGAVIGFTTEFEWSDLLIDYGPLREATEDEARHLTVRYKQVSS